MSRQSTADRWADVHSRALKRFDAIWQVQQDERRECLDDRRFATIRGAQWDDEWQTQFENAPRIEVNKTHKELVRIFSDYRNNRISVDFRPDDETGDDETADNLDGLYRADFEDCGQEAQDNAFDEGTGGGMGAWRLRAAYEDESDPDNDHQRICFEPITDADQRVFFGPSTRQDKADAKFAIVLNPLDEDDFAEAYPDASPVDFANLPMTIFQWFQPVPKIVTVAEYYEITEKRTKRVTLTHAVIQEDQNLTDPTEQQLADLEAQGWKVDRTRTIKKPSVTKYTISGIEVLAEEQIPGPNIPIIVYYAKRWVSENIEHFAGHTRYAKDPQRVYNAQVSQLAMVAAISPLERPIFDPEQIAGQETEWAQANLKRAPYSLARALRDEDGKVVAMGPIGKVEPPTVPAALAALIQLSGNDIAELTGASDQKEEVPANTSAQAIQLVHNRADAKTFIYLDNFAKAVKRCGDVWLGMCKELYVEEGRKMQAIDQHGAQSYVTLAQPAMAKDGSQITANDFASGNWRVIVDVGPSSQSRRDATVNAMLGIANIAHQAGDDQLAGACINAAISQMDGEGIQGLKKFARLRAVQSGVEEPTDEEKQELAQQAQNAPPDPTAELAAAKAEDLQASANQRKADALLKVAQTTVLGGPDKAPDVPTGLKAVHEAVQIRKTAAEADNLEADTAHMPTKLAIEATNAATNRLKAHKANGGNSPAQ